MIPLKDQDAIRMKFGQELLGPVKIDYFTQKELDIVVPGREPCATCKPTGQMLRELAALSDLISLRVHIFDEEREEAAKFGVERIPGIVLRGRDTASMKVYGMPAGTEFPTFLDSISDVSCKAVMLSPESVKALRKVKEDLRVKVFVAPMCLYSPGPARAAFQLSIVNPRVKAEVIQADEFPALAQRYEVKAVPLTVIEDRIAVVGAVPEKGLVEQVVKASQSAAAQPSDVRGPSTPWEPPKGEKGKGEAQAGGSGLILPPR